MTAKDRIRLVLDTLTLQGAAPEELDFALDELLDEVREDLVAEEAVKPREGVAAEVEVVVA